MDAALERRSATSRSGRGARRYPSIVYVRKAKGRLFQAGPFLAFNF